MASIRTEIEIDVDADRAWGVIGNWVDGPVGMGRGYVVSSQADADFRVVTFAKGTIARERLVARDEGTRRVVYSLIGDTVRPEHDNTAMQIVSLGARRCRFIWSRDVLPDELAGPLHAVMEEAAPIIKRTLEDDLAAQQRARCGLGGAERGRIACDSGQDQRSLDQ
jgi:hypothetical protein